MGIWVIISVTWYGFLETFLTKEYIEKVSKSGLVSSSPAWTAEVSFQGDALSVQGAMRIET
jgi:hypothetical protein